MSASCSDGTEAMAPAAAAASVESSKQRKKQQVGINFVKLDGKILRLKIESCGLREVLLPLGDQHATVISCWMPKSSAKRVQNGKPTAAANAEASKAAAAPQEALSQEQQPDSPGLKSSSQAKTLNPKPALLCLHGFGASAMWQWEQQVKAYSRHFEVYIVDLLFFGKSTSAVALDDVADKRRDWIGFQAECVLKAMEMVGVERFHVNGISYGGFVAYRMALMQPSRIEKIIFSNSGIAIQTGEYHQMLKRWGAKDLPSLLLPSSPEHVQLLLDLAYYKATKMPSWILKQTLETLFSENVEGKTCLARGLEDWYKEPPELETFPGKKILIVWGENEECYILDIAKRMKSFFGDDSSLIVLPKACHMPNIQHARKYNKATVAFLLE